MGLSRNARQPHGACAGTVKPIPHEQKGGFRTLAMGRWGEAKEEMGQIKSWWLLSESLRPSSTRLHLHTKRSGDRKSWTSRG